MFAGYIHLRFNKYAVFISFLLILIQITPSLSPQSVLKKKQNGFVLCCAFPCENGGVCIPLKFSYTCDCHNTGYYGKDCVIETWITFFKIHFNTIMENVISIYYAFCTAFKAHSLYFPSYYKMTEDSFNKIHSVSIYPLSGKSYTTLNSLYNNYAAVRMMSPVPEYCPTPLGIKGKKTLNPVCDVYDRLLMRQHYNPSKSINLLFTVYGLHFFLQFLNHGNLHGITCSHIYMENWRTFSKGKLIIETIKGEDYPLPQQINRKKTFTHFLGKSEQASWSMPLLKQNSLTYVMATLWVREHNRVCDVLAKLWPSWDDNRIFETAKNIVTGEILVITLSEWYPVLIGHQTNMFYDPSYTHSGYFLFNNKLPIEIFLTLLYPNLIPENFIVNNKTIEITKTFWNSLDDNLIKNQGLYNVLRSFSSNPSGMMGIQNTARSQSEIVKWTIEMGRKLRIPSFNKIRAHLGLKPYKTFSQIAKNDKRESILKNIYETVDGIEFMTGILIESNVNQRKAVGETAATLIGSWLFKAALTHPLGSKSMWKPTTMGGKVGWDIVNNAKLQKLICRNVAQSEMCIKERLVRFKLKPEKRKKVCCKSDKKQKKRSLTKTPPHV